MISHLKLHNITEEGETKVEPKVESSSEEEDQAQPERPKRDSQRSWVWNYFSEFSKTTVTCDICKAQIGRPNFSTTAMINHLKRHDIHEQENYEENDSASDEENVEKTQDGSSSEDEEQSHFEARLKGVRKSWVWIHYKRESKTSAVCTICEHRISRNNGGTSAMISHLKLHNITEDLEPIGEIVTVRDDEVEPRDESSSKEDENTQLEIRPKQDTQRSWVWNYFSEFSKIRGICDICRTQIGRPNSSTTAMRNHLIYKHKIHESALVEKSQVIIKKKAKLKLDNLAKTNAHRSWVWNYFGVLSREKAECGLCEKQISRSGSTTAGMRNHLRICHSIVEELDFSTESHRVPQDAKLKLPPSVQFISGEVQNSMKSSQFNLFFQQRIPIRLNIATSAMKLLEYAGINFARQLASPTLR